MALLRHERIFRLFYRYVLVVLAAASLATGYLLASVEPALAYTSFGCTWTNPKGLVYINNSTGGSNYYNDTQQVVANWQAATSHIALNSWGGGNWQIVMYDQNQGNNGDAGDTTIGWDIFHHCSDQSAHSAYNTFYADQPQYGDTGKVAVMTHELGHSLGLGHSGSLPCPTPIMETSVDDFYFTCGEYTPQSDDINGINAYYP